jgi:hypothetical protein
MDQLAATIGMLAEAVAERIGSRPDEFVVRNFGDREDQLAACLLELELVRR